MSKKQYPRTTKAADQYITITVAEYHCLTKAATLLEVVLNDSSSYHSAIDAVKAVVADMAKTAEAGAAE